MRETRGTTIRLNSNPIPLTKSLVIGDRSVSLLAVLVRSFSLVSMAGEDGSSTIWTVKRVYATHLLKEIDVTQTAMSLRNTQVIMSWVNWLAKTLAQCMNQRTLRNKNKFYIFWINDIFDLISVYT